MSDLQQENSAGSQNQPNSASTNADFDIDGNVGGNVTVGNNNVVNNTINNYYQKEVEKNVEKHEPDYWALKHPYPMPPNFTGRIAERATLTHWLREDPENRLFILRALGGFGKSALAWQWLTHDVDIKEYPKVVFWSFYEGDASFEHFIEETLKYLKLDVSQGQRPQVDELLKAMQGQKILLIMDGFERALRAYSGMNAAYQGDREPGIQDNQFDCVNINAEIFLKSLCSLPNIRSKVLMTTRLTPRAVKPRGEFMLGCREEELTAMQKADAVEFFHKQKIKGTHAEIETACSPYGYHPLSLRLLAGFILKNLHKPRDISVSEMIKTDDNLKQNQNRVLKAAYNSLFIQQQILLSQIACFRSPVKVDMLTEITKPVTTKGIFGLYERSIQIYSGRLDNDLQDLLERGLLHFDEKNKKFDLHPIVRHYAYERLAKPDRVTAHIRLRDYFASVEVLAEPKNLNDLGPIIELYHHTVITGKFDIAWNLFQDRLHDPLYYQFGAYQFMIELMTALQNAPRSYLPSLSKELDQAWFLTALGNAYSQSGQPHQAIPMYKNSVLLAEKNNDKENAGIALVNLAYMAQIHIGALKEAEYNLQHYIIEFEHLSETNGENANAHYEFSRLQIYKGEWDKAEKEMVIALRISENQKDSQDQSIIWAYRALLLVLMRRTSQDVKIDKLKLAIEYSLHALELADLHYLGFPVERDYVRIHWLLGTAYRMSGQLDFAERHMSEAMIRCHAIALVRDEADILLDFARLRYDQKNYDEAKILADEALLITERCGYVLQGADVNLFLAQYVLEQEKDRAKAKGYAETALNLAYCDGPPYYYKVAYDEAVAMLERLKV